MPTDWTAVGTSLERYSTDPPTGLLRDGSADARREYADA